MSIYQYKIKSIDGKDLELEAFKGKVLLVVNVASQCGFTPQYKGLEKLYREYKNQGLEILAFPCNQFGAQEPGEDKEIQNFCKLTYDVTFPLFAKIAVNGKEAHPFFQHLKKEAPGLLGTEAIKWNFTKFLINRQGEVFKRFAPNDAPSSLVKDIEFCLKS